MKTRTQAYNEWIKLGKEIGTEKRFLTYWKKVQEQNDKEFGHTKVSEEYADCIV